MVEMSTLPENPAEQQQQGEEGERNTGGNRWPREETMALLKIRSEMDGAFREISPKAPLWEQVSRKLAELGYQRSGKKCKEKFENIYKYHRRTKEGRSTKQNGKTYRFFDQLEALDTHHSEGQQPPQPATINNNGSSVVNVIRDAVPCSVRFPSAAEYHEHSISTSSATSSSSAGEEEEEEEEEGDKKMRKRRRVRVRHMFEGLMRQVIEKQESLQRKFMEVLDRCEQDRMAREQAWKAQELARIQRERELLAQERSIAAAKDEAVLAFLKKFAENGGVPDITTTTTTTQTPIAPSHDRDIMMREEDGNGKNNTASVVDKDKEEQHSGNNAISVGNFVHMSSSRWPKDEVEALIRLRTQLDVQHQGNNNSNGSSNKGPLWEEISLAMKGLGYDRSAKRCKEKWENINKYFKRMKENNKRKPEDSKTCPYYHHLEALYSNKKTNKVDESGGSGNEFRPEELLMHIMSGQEDRQQHQLDSSSEDVADRENNEQNHQGDHTEDGGCHQMVANSPNSIAIMG